MTAGAEGPVTPLWATISRTVAAHVAQYRAAATAQRDQALALLRQAPPDYSSAATACHRALQFTRQADALEQVAVDADLW